MQQFEDYRNRALVDSHGDKVGTIEDVYADQQTGRPDWALVSTGLFGTRKSFVPVTTLHAEGEVVRAPFTKDQIHSAPQLDDEEEIPAEAEERLFQHYGLPYRDDGTVTAQADARSPSTAGEPVVERHEEQLRVGKVRRPSELVRLRKRVEVEPVSTSVELEREEVRVVREPVGESEMRGQHHIAEAEQEVVLEREEPVVGKTVVAKERIRLDKEATVETRRVEDEVRKERVDVERTDEGR